MEIRNEFKFIFSSEAKYMCVVAARGLGKTVAATQFILYKIFSGKPNCQAIFFSTTLKQARETVDPIMTQLLEDFPKDFCSYNKTEHKYYFRVSETDTRSLVLLSYEKEESKRGYHPQFIVLDECATLSERMFNSIILPTIGPAMSHGDGRLLCIGTAKGQTLFYKLWSKGGNPKHKLWESYAITASSSNILSQEYLDTMRESLTTREYEQEFECDFNANVVLGSVYGEYIDRFADQNISPIFNYIPDLPVYTSWDIGSSNNTAIWFFQLQHGQPVFIDVLL